MRRARKIRREEEEGTPSTMAFVVRETGSVMRRHLVPVVLRAASLTLSLQWLTLHVEYRQNCIEINAKRFLSQCKS